MEKLSCGHYATKREVEKSGTCCVECKKCQTIVCIAEKHDCGYSKKNKRKKVIL